MSCMWKPEQKSPIIHNQTQKKSRKISNFLSHFSRDSFSWLHLKNYCFQGLMGKCQDLFYLIFLFFVELKMRFKQKWNIKGKKVEIELKNYLQFILSSNWISLRCEGKWKQAKVSRLDIKYYSCFMIYYLQIKRRFRFYYYYIFCTFLSIVIKSSFLFLGGMKWSSIL